MSMQLAHALHEARDRILLLKEHLEASVGREIPAYRPLLTEQVQRLDTALQQANIPEHYRVAVVGRFKVGKSAFVNSLTGERLLAGVDTNPETAAISIFRYGSTARAEVELISREEWDQLATAYDQDPKDPEVKRYDRFFNFNERPVRKDRRSNEGTLVKVDLRALARDWVQAGGKRHMIPSNNWHTEQGKKTFRAEIRKFTSSQGPLHYLVNRVTIYAPVPILRDHIEIVDTPGLDDTEHFRVLLTEELVKDVDAILFLTASGASYSQSDKDFIVRQLRRRQLKHLQIIVTKCDETYENACRDAQERDDLPPSYEEFSLGEANRVRAEVKSTLDELLQFNQLSDEEGYYFIEQLDEVPIRLISTKYHDQGGVERGGIEAVRNGLYHVLSTSQRFEKARSLLRDSLESVIKRLTAAFLERQNTLEKDFDPTKIKAQIEAIQNSLSSDFDTFGERLGEALLLLDKDHEVFFETLPVHLDLIMMHAKEVLTDLEKSDLVRHWKTRRHGRWGYLYNLQSKVADTVFPKVEALLNKLRAHLDTFMAVAGTHMKRLETTMTRVEREHRLSGLAAIALAATQTPQLESLRGSFEVVVNSERDAIVTNLDDFVSDTARERLDAARQDVAQIWGVGTTLRQDRRVSDFYTEVRQLLAHELRTHIESRIQGFAKAIRTSAESVAPRIREASEAIIEQRLQAIESSLQIEADGQKEEVSRFLKEMTAFFTSLTDEASALQGRGQVTGVSASPEPLQGAEDKANI